MAKGKRSGGGKGKVNIKAKATHHVYYYPDTHVVEFKRIKTR